MNRNEQGAPDPLKRVLVPTDFSPGAELAIGRALLLPLASTATVHLVHVLSPDLPRRLRAGVNAEARRALQCLLEGAQQRARGSRVTVTSEVRSGESFVEIIRSSRELEAELIVIGRHGRRPVRDMVIGTTVERVIRHGDVPVLAVNLEPASPYARPLIATDLGDTASRVVELALRITLPAAQTLRVVHAYRAPFEGFVAPTAAARASNPYRQSFREAAKQGVAELVSRFSNLGVGWKSTVREGEARSVILAEALRVESDLVALGTHGRSGLAHALVGSVADWVIAQLPCDVLVARPVRFSFSAP